MFPQRSQDTPKRQVLLMLSNRVHSTRCNETPSTVTETTQGKTCPEIDMNTLSVPLICDLILYIILRPTEG